MHKYFEVLFIFFPHKFVNRSLKSSSTTQSNTWSPTKSSPFRFRSEERAIKRKEASSYLCPIH